MAGLLHALRFGDTSNITECVKDRKFSKRIPFYLVKAILPAGGDPAQNGPNRAAGDTTMRTKSVKRVLSGAALATVISLALSAPALAEGNGHDGGQHGAQVAQSDDHHDQNHQDQNQVQSTDGERKVKEGDSKDKSGEGDRKVKEGDSTDGDNDHDVAGADDHDGDAGDTAKVGEPASNDTDNDRSNDAAGGDDNDGDAADTVRDGGPAADTDHDNDVAGVDDHDGDAADSNAGGASQPAPASPSAPGGDSGGAAPVGTSVPSAPGASLPGSGVPVATGGTLGARAGGPAGAQTLATGGVQGVTAAAAPGLVGGVLGLATTPNTGAAAPFGLGSLLALLGFGALRLRRRGADAR